MYNISSLNKERVENQVMNTELRVEAEEIVRAAIMAMKPDHAVQRAMSHMEFSGKVYIVAVGKAAWQMAFAAQKGLKNSFQEGIVVTKYHHVIKSLDGIDCYEAGHPIPDQNSFLATDAVLKMTQNLSDTDTVLFLLSGGGSALFELPLVSQEELSDITRQLLACGADIVEINTIRKRLSAVKGGKFAQWCAPAKVEAIILSDILGDPLDMIASGPVCADPTTCDQALRIAKKYNLKLSRKAQECLHTETPKELGNSQARIIGSVKELCLAATRECRKRGYEVQFLTDQLNCEAREAGRFMSSIIRSHIGTGKRLAILAGGETVVHLTGHGLGGRNQELALAAAEGLSGIPNAALISVGSDGTDGPTDAAGGYVDGRTYNALREKNIALHESLIANDAYHALQAVNGLVMTGPTGTNVNDIVLALIQ